MSRSFSTGSLQKALGLTVFGLGVAYLIGRFWLSLGLYLPFELYLVQSGSMEPAINAGDIVVVKPQPNYHQRQVITFYDQDDRVVTHRILEVRDQAGRTFFLTKGDANEAPDSYLVPREKVIGRLALVLPRMGFVVSFAKTRYGALLLVIVPAVIIIYDEFRKMKE